MTTKEWLNRGWQQDKYINSLLAEKEEALTRATSVTVSAEGERVQNSSGNSTERKMLKYAEYSELIDKQVDRLVDIKSEIIKAINRVEDNILRTLLIDRYIRFMKWEQIAVDLNYSYEWTVKRLHPKALEKIKEFIVIHIAPMV